MSSARSLANRILHAVVPRRDREWLQALFAELPAVDHQGKPMWILGASTILGQAIARRLFSDAPLWSAGLAAGLVVAYMGLEVDGLALHLFVLACSVACLALLAPDWAWRWALLVSMPKPLFVELGWYGPYFHDRFDAYYAVLPAVAIALAVAWSRGFVGRRFA